LSRSNLPKTPAVFLTPRELAQRHHTSTGHLANLRMERRGVPYISLSSRRVLYRLADVEAYEAARLVQTASAA
jgi:hypothetical protein